MVNQIYIRDPIFPYWKFLGKIFLRKMHVSSSIVPYWNWIGHLFFLALRSITIVIVQLFLTLFFIHHEFPFNIWFPHVFGPAGGLIWPWDGLLRTEILNHMILTEKHKINFVKQKGQKRWWTLICGADFMYIIWSNGLNSRIPNGDNYLIYFICKLFL